MFRISVLKLALTVPLMWLGLRLSGPIGALGGRIAAEESCQDDPARARGALVRLRLLRNAPARALVSVARRSCRDRARRVHAAPRAARCPATLPDGRRVLG